jgi:hypothetical protein
VDSERRKKIADSVRRTLAKKRERAARAEALLKRGEEIGVVVLTEAE